MRFLHSIFANMKFWQPKIQCIFCKWRKHSTASLRNEPTAFVSIDILGYHYSTSVLCCYIFKLKFGYLQRGLIIDQIWRKRFFSKIVPVLRNTFQYLGGISQEISGSHFDSRRSLSSANRRQIVGNLPGRFFLSALLSLVISMTGRSERSARALCDGADVVREAIGN